MIYHPLTKAIKTCAVPGNMRELIFKTLYVDQVKGEKIQKTVSRMFSVFWHLKMWNEQTAFFLTSKCIIRQKFQVSLTWNGFWAFV